MVWNGQSKLFDIYTGERDGAIRGVGGWPVLQSVPWRHVVSVVALSFKRQSQLFSMEVRITPTSSPRREI